MITNRKKQKALFYARLCFLAWQQQNLARKNAMHLNRQGPSIIDMKTFTAVFKVDENKLKPALAIHCVTSVLSSKTLHCNNNWGEQGGEKKIEV